MASEDAPILPDDLADTYARQVEALTESLNIPEAKLSATDKIRSMVDRIAVHWEEEARSHTIKIEGELVALLKAGPNETAAAFGAAANSLKLVAGACNQRYLHFDFARLPLANLLQNPRRRKEGKSP